MRKEKRYREGQRVMYSVEHSCHAATLPIQPFLFVHNFALPRFKPFVPTRPGTMIVHSNLKEGERMFSNSMSLLFSVSAVNIYDLGRPPSQTARGFNTS